MKSILCFGDSNTHGTGPMSELGVERRWPFEQRWPGVLQGRLGPAWRVIEEGLPGRTIGRDDPVEGADRNALRYLPACLRSHRPLDAVVFLLGTNDLKARFDADARAIAQGVHALLDAVELNLTPGQARPRVLVVSPPPVLERGCLATMFSGAERRAAGLADAYAAVARARQVDHLDAGPIAPVSPIDGVHLEQAGQHQLGQRIADWVLAG